ncbi:LysR family transcriptional regulator [Aliivibrio sifiae]|uniref:LysR family transcriptional regulator n=1 Tax=Aliivibrio sifiae TaxID=566293 RepID=A0A2S7X662_9GAMM|nr:LysR family transcriptional regulator [Aliivibrio sifiae]PQJ86854.1 LysR family transcriptional regulator [Aliivibrio sifiae]GLR74027.1 LysR family transcriptional regulator [Aliivibrio sifiae]
MKNFDLNLLRILTILLETRSTTITAERLHTSQSAISRSLRKLRDLFQDDLLIRKSGRFELTIKAEALAQALPAIFNDIDELMWNAEPFEPLAASSNVIIAMNSSIAQWFAPILIQHISHIAPNLSLTIVDWTESSPDDIAAGNVQYGINYFPMELPKHLIQKKGGIDSFVLVCRKEHEHVGKVMSAIDFQHYPIAIHVIQDWNDKKDHLSRILTPMDIMPSIKLRSSHLNIILQAIEQSDMLLPCSKHLAQSLEERFSYIEFDNKLDTPQGNFGFVYAVKWRNDPLLKWLNTSISTLVNTQLNQ